MGREFELKYRATPEAQERIAARLGGFTPISMETTYYDTPGKALSRLRITLRRRRENDRQICTLKTPADGFGRGEWEIGCPRIEDALSPLFAMSGRDDLSRLTRQGVIAVCGARFTRLVKTVVLAQCSVEVALDQGVLLGGGKEAPLCEVEVELKSGREQAAADYARALAEEFSLCPEEKSKFRRALALAEEVANR